VESKCTFRKLAALALAFGALTICPPGNAATWKTGEAGGPRAFGGKAAETEETPSVRIHLQIPQLTGDQSIDVFAYDHQTRRDGQGAVGGGAGTGKLEAGPVTVGKQIDCYTPTLHQIHLTGIHLKEVFLRWSRFDPDNNTEYLFFTIKLTDVTISGIHTRLPNQHDPDLVKLGEIEEVSFSYSKIEMMCGGV
jgi:type VI secretion system Hcp family effector